MFSSIALIVGGMAGVFIGLPLSHRWQGILGILAAAAVLAGIIAFLCGIVVLIVPNFFLR